MEVDSVEKEVHSSAVVNVALSSCFQCPLREMEWSKSACEVTAKQRLPMSALGGPHISVHCCWIKVGASGTDSLLRESDLLFWWVAPMLLLPLPQSLLLHPRQQTRQVSFCGSGFRCLARVVMHKWKLCTNTLHLPLAPAMVTGAPRSVWAAACCTTRTTD